MLISTKFVAFFSSHTPLHTPKISAMINFDCRYYWKKRRRRVSRRLKGSTWAQRRHGLPTICLVLNWSHISALHSSNLQAAPSFKILQQQTLSRRSLTKSMPTRLRSTQTAEQNEVDAHKVLSTHTAWDHHHRQNDTSVTRHGKWGVTLNRRPRVRALPSLWAAQAVSGAGGGTKEGISGEMLRELVPIWGPSSCNLPSPTCSTLAPGTKEGWGH